MIVFNGKEGAQIRMTVSGVGEVAFDTIRTVYIHDGFFVVVHDADNVTLYAANKVMEVELHGFDKVD
jgi:glutamate dehydrogenase/leucine dehydrogenase